MNPQNESTKARLDFLHDEVSILASKINGTVDRLWKIRGLGITVWSGLIAIGLGAATGDKKEIHELLWISFAIPLLFWWIDTTYNSWYCRFVIREREISKFINGSNYIVPKTNVDTSFSAFIENKNDAFPIFDQGGHDTFGNNGWFKWKTGKFHSFADIRPLIIFGGQVLVSGALILNTISVPVWYSLAILFIFPNPQIENRFEVKSF